MLPPRAYTFIGLNIVRALSIIALLLVFSSSIVVMVHDVEAVNRFIAAGKVAKDTNNSTFADDHIDCDYIDGSTVPNQAAGAFWAVLNRLLIIFQVIALLFSELSFPMKFFNAYFPVLGTEFGLGPLGVIQCLIGAAVLSHHVDDFALVSAFFLFSVGCLNILLGLIFRQKARSKRSLLSWRETAKAAKGVLPTSISSSKAAMKYDYSSSPAPYVRDLHTGSSEKTDMSESSDGKASYGFGRQGEKAAALKGFLISKPVEALPRYVPKSSYDRGTMFSPTPTHVGLK